MTSTDPMQPEQSMRLVVEGRQRNEKPEQRVDSQGRLLCTAHSKSSGKPCNGPSVAGTNVCRMHGGASPQVRRKASLRLIELVDPALAVLARELTSTTNKSADRLRAVENILDRAGLPRAGDATSDLTRELLIERLRALREQVVKEVQDQQRAEAPRIIEHEEST